MPAPPARPEVVWWRLGLLLTLGGTISSHPSRTTTGSSWRATSGRRSGRRLLSGRTDTAWRARSANGSGGSALRRGSRGRSRACSAAPSRPSRAAPTAAFSSAAGTARGLALAKLGPNGELDRAFTERLGDHEIAGTVDRVSCDDTGIVARGCLQERTHPQRPVSAIRFDQEGRIDREFLRGQYQYPQIPGGYVSQVAPSALRPAAPPAARAAAAAGLRDLPVYSAAPVFPRLRSSPSASRRPGKRTTAGRRCWTEAARRLDAGVSTWAVCAAGTTRCFANAGRAGSPSSTRRADWSRLPRWLRRGR